VLLAIILGPHAGAIVISSVVIIQCLIFQDGGLLALGCNIINMAIVPSYLGYFLYKTVAADQMKTWRGYAGAMLACIIAIEAGAILVPIQATLSGVLMVPFSTFLITMIGVHLLVGIIEGLITIAVLGYLHQVRPAILTDPLPGKERLSTNTVFATLIIFTVIVAGGLSLLASENPDGLEYSYAERPDQPDFETIVSNDTPAIAAVDDFHSKYSLMPDYSLRSSPIGKVSESEGEASAGWTSFAGVTGAGLTMAIVWLTARVLRRKKIVKA
jgi:cobalt/nickel transport system permease protein